MDEAIMPLGWLAALLLIVAFAYSSVGLGGGSSYTALMAAVLVGGAVGSFLGASRLEPRKMQKLLGGIVLIAIVLLARKVLTI